MHNAGVQSHKVRWSSVNLQEIVVGGCDSISQYLSGARIGQSNSVLQPDDVESW